MRPDRSWVVWLAVVSSVATMALLAFALLTFDRKARARRALQSSQVESLGQAAAFGFKRSLSTLLDHKRPCSLLRPLS